MEAVCEKNLRFLSRSQRTSNFFPKSLQTAHSFRICLFLDTETKRKFSKPFLIQLQLTLQQTLQIESPNINKNNCQISYDSDKFSNKQQQNRTAKPVFSTAIQPTARGGLPVASACDFGERLESLRILLKNLEFFAHTASMQCVQKKGRV